MAFFNSIFENSTSVEFDSVLTENECGEAGADSLVYMEEALCDYDTNMMQLEAALYIVDAKLETSVYEGASIESVESVLENALTDFIDNIKKFIADLWEKFSKFVTDTVVKIKNFMATSNSFVSKNESAITKAAAQSTYQYSGPRYNISVLDNGDLYTLIPKETDKITSKFADINASEMSSLADDYVDTMWADVAKSIGTDKNEGTGISMVINAARKLAEGSTETEKELSGSDVTAYINFVKKSKSTLDAIYAAKNATKKSLDGSIKALNKLAAKSKKDDKTEEAATVKRAAKMVSRVSGDMSRYMSSVINIYTTAYKTMTARLKGVLASGKKNVKDANKASNVSASFASGSDSLLSAAFEML